MSHLVLDGSIDDIKTGILFCCYSCFVDKTNL